MALSYVKLPDNSLGNLVFIGHEETIKQGSGKDRVAVAEVYLLSSDKLGTITATVPTQNAVKGNFFRKKVTLSGLSVVSNPVSSVNKTTGSVTVRVKDFLHAENISVEGAVK